MFALNLVELLLHQVVLKLGLFKIVVGLPDLLLKRGALSFRRLELPLLICQVCLQNEQQVVLALNLIEHFLALVLLLVSSLNYLSVLLSALLKIFLHFEHLITQVADRSLLHI